LAKQSCPEKFQAILSYSSLEECQAITDSINEVGLKTSRVNCAVTACQFKINKKTNELEIENYQNPWKLQNIMDRSKE
jgi:hypothetical protein